MASGASRSTPPGTAGRPSPRRGRTTRCSPRSTPSSTTSGSTPSHPPDCWRALGWGWSGDERGYEERVAEAVAEGGLEAQARRAHTLGPDGRYRSHPGPELLCRLESLGHRPDNPFVDVGNYARLACPTLLVCATDGTGADNRAFIDSMPGQFPAVRVVWMDGPHSLNYAHPALVADHIRRFVTAG